MSYGMTDTGFVVKDFNTIKAEMITEAKALWGEAFDIRETNPTVVMFNILATHEQQHWNIASDSYTNLFIATSSGVALDVLAIDRGLSRLPSSKSSGTITVSGTVGTIISATDRFATSGDNTTYFVATETKNLGLTTEQFINGVTELTSEDYPSTNQDTDQPLEDTGGGIIEVAQSFTGDGGIISSARFYLKQSSGALTGNMQVDVYAHSGTYGTSSVPTGTTLATSDVIAASTLTASYADIEFTFSGVEKILLEKDVNYTLVLSTAVTPHASDYIDVGVDASTPTHGGNFATSTGSWTAVAGTDAVFRVSTEGTQQLATEAFGSYNPTSPWFTVIVDAISYTEIADPTPSLPASTEFWVDYESPNTTIYFSGAKTSVVVSVTYYDATATSVDVLIEADLGGTEYNVGIGTIDSVAASSSTISTVTNAAAITGGTDVEDDLSLRSRLIDAPVASWTEADIKALVENISGVRGAVIVDGETIDSLLPAGESAESTWWKNTMTSTTLNVLRVTFYDDSASASYDLVEATVSQVDAGEYAYDTGSGATDIIHYRGPNDTGDLQTDDILTVTFMDSTIGTGLFRLNIIPTSPPLTSTLTDTISSSVRLNKHPGVSFFIDEPFFNTIALTIDLDMETGYTETDVTTEIGDLLTTHFISLTIGETLRHANIINIIMDVTGVLDVTDILYQSENESITKGVEQGTDNAQQVIVDNANFTSITDSDSVVYTKDTHFQVTTGDVDWSISTVGATVYYRRYEAAGYTSTLVVFGGAPDTANEYYIGHGTVTSNMIQISATTTMDCVVTGTWKYWDGSVWQALQGVIDGASDWNFTSGNVYLTFIKPTDWATTSVDGQTAYWIKYEVDTYTSSANSTMDVDPVLHLEPASSVIYTATYDIITDDNVVPISTTIIGEGTVILQ